MITITNISKAYAATPVLEGCSLSRCRMAPSMRWPEGTVQGNPPC